MLLYDNFEDVKAKLYNTFCYYQNKMAHVRDVMLDIDPQTGKDLYLLRLQVLNSRHYITIRLDDPDFNYMRYNLGYSNHGHSAVWWYRIPIKQYHQGLRNGQLKRKASNTMFIHQTEFGFNESIAAMMECRYPHFEQVEKRLKDKTQNIMAFHPDFACTWDPIHSDMILEYKGTQVGSIISPSSFHLMEEYKHLTEALKEAVA